MRARGARGRPLSSVISHVILGQLLNPSHCNFLLCRPKGFYLSDLPPGAFNTLQEGLCVWLLTQAGAALPLGSWIMKGAPWQAVQRWDHNVIPGVLGWALNSVPNLSATSWGLWGPSYLKAPWKRVLGTGSDVDLPYDQENPSVCFYTQKMHELSLQRLSEIGNMGSWL